MYMAVFLIILSCLLWAASIRMLMGRQGIAPVLSWLGLGAISLASRDGYHILPVNGTILTAWLCMTVVVTLVSYLQPEAVRRQTRGMGYIAGGALAGMAVGLLACSFTTSIGILYTSMISGTVAGIFFGLLIYSRTPDGRPVGIGSGPFLQYLLAKGFPTAITVMQIGVAIVLAVAVYNVSAL